jgi:hypothetical protein
VPAFVHFGAEMDLVLEITGDVVEWQELLDGTQTVSIQGASEDGRWMMESLVSWNIGMDADTNEGDITLAQHDGAELSGALSRATARIEEGGGFALTLEYEIDAVSGPLEGRLGRIHAEASLSRREFRGRWRVLLDR